MNNNNVFLQLRELDERNIPLNRINGNFNINLKRPLILNEGDELLVIWLIESSPVILLTFTYCLILIPLFNASDLLNKFSFGPLIR